MVTEQKTEPRQIKEQRKPNAETISQRVRRHITDIKSRITDEDIRNARLELEVENKATYDLFQR
jgi:hypothetical protein